MRVILQKIGALLLAMGALGALLANAALAHGCGGARVEQGEAQAPSPAAAPPSAAGSPQPGPRAYEEMEYMGATKAPPMPAFRSRKSSAGSDVDETEDARDGNAQQAP